MSKKRREAAARRRAGKTGTPGPRTSRRWFLLGVALALAGGAAWWWVTHPSLDYLPAPHTDPAPNVAWEDFVGAETCAGCHADEYAVWRASTHGRAGGHPDSVRLLASFDGTPIRFRDGTVTPRRREDGAYVFDVAPDREAAESFVVTGVVGGAHMVGGGTQGFFSSFADGTERFLPFDYSGTADTWFCNTAGRRNQGWLPIDTTLALADCADWPPFRVLGERPAIAHCQQCHGSQIVLEAAGPNRYVTRFVSLAINCESCHGPGRTHVERMRAGDPGPDIGMASLDTLSEDASLEVCFRCHALKTSLDDVPYLPGDAFAEAYSLKLPDLMGGPHFPDGRVRTFAYQETHLASDCYLNGRMTCTDCHDPHAQTYRDAFGRPLADRFDDGQCTACHPSKAVEGSAHTRHAASGPGSRCVACHMPYLQHPTVGPEIPYGRSDHAITIPRPGLDAALNIEGACAQCHAGLEPERLASVVEEWWGPTKPPPPATQAAFAIPGARDLAAAASMALGLDRDAQPLARYRALSVFFLRWIRPDMPDLDPGIVARLEELGRDPDDDVAALALASLHIAAGDVPTVHDYLERRLADLGGREIAVRRRWAAILRLRAGSLGADPPAMRRLYEKLRELVPDDPAAIAALQATAAR